METYLNTVERECLMAARGVMEIFLGMSLYNYTGNLLAKAISLPNQMILASTTNALPHIKTAWSDQPDTIDESKRDNTTPASEEFVERNDARLCTRKGTHIFP